MRRHSLTVAGSIPAVLALTLSACGSAAPKAASAASPAGGTASTVASGTAAGSGDVSSTVLALAPVAPASQIPAGSTMATIRQRGYLKMGGTRTAPLFDLLNPVTGQRTGFDALLGDMLAKYIIGRPEVRLTQNTVQTREPLLETNAVDVVIATYTITAKRAKLVGFAGPYYSSGDAIMVKSSDSTIHSPSDLNGKTVVTETASTAALDLKTYAPKAKLLLLDTNSECLAALTEGRASAYVIDQAILIGDATNTPGVKVVGQPFTSEPYGIGVNRSHTRFKAFINSWLRLIESDGAWAAAWKATIGTVVPGAPPTPPAIAS